MLSLDSPDYPGDPPFIHDDVIKEVRKAWEKENVNRKAPKRALAVIKEAIGSDTNPPKSRKADPE